MNNLHSLELLMIKQTCRFFACKFETVSNQSPSSDAPGIYTDEFLKVLYEQPKENVAKIYQTKQMQNGDCNGENQSEAEILLEFFRKVVDRKSHPAKQWTELQHYLCFVYRCCMTSDPDPEQEILSPYFLADMRNIVCNLMEEDQVQLCLRLFSLVREFTIFSQKQHQKIQTVEASIESLFYYYEAFLSATKNICKIFPELERLLINTYKLGWLDFNTSIFMYYFYETPYVQNVVSEFEQMKDNVSIKAAGIYTVLTELHKLWRSQMLGINTVIASKLGAKFKGLGNKMMSYHKRILSKNFWIDRCTNEKNMQDMRLFDCQLFTLVGNKNLVIPEPTLDDSGQCLCEDCLIIKYKSLIENTHKKITRDCIKVSCKSCRQQVDLDQFQRHVDGRHLAEFKSHNCVNLTKMMGMNGRRRNNDVKSMKRCENSNGDTTKDPSPKIANEPPIFRDDADLTSRRIEREKDIPCDRILGKNYEKEKTHNEHNHIVTNEESKGSEVKKNSHSSNKSSGMTFPCGHSCKLEEELKSEFKKAYQDTCDHHKESKKCDCTFCEVFGTTTTHVHKVNETRNRLRIRLNQRIENGNGKTKTNSSNKSNKSESPPICDETLNDDIHGLLNFIEGNSNVDRFAIAEKKAAKKARQRFKKEQERLRIEEEERKRIEEEKRKTEERLRSEELARQLAEKAAKKEIKKKKQKAKNKELVEETIPAMVTIKRVVENDNKLPTVTITLKGSTPDQDKLLYTLVNGHEGDNEVKKNKKKDVGKKQTVNLEVNSNLNQKKKKKDANNIVTKEVRVTLAVDSVDKQQKSKINNDIKNTKKIDNNIKKEKNKSDINIPMLKLPPGITITKVDGPMGDRNYKTTNMENPSYSSNIPVSKSGVIVVDTEKLIKQSNTTNNKKNKKKQNKKQKEINEKSSSMVTLKNPIFQNIQNTRPEPEIDLSNNQQAAIFKNENGMVTIRSSRLQQSLNNITPMTNLMPELKPVLGPEVSNSFMPSCNYSEYSKISSLNAQEILSGLPGIEITKVDKNSIKHDDDKKSCHTAEVSIIPANSDKFHFDKDDLHYDNVFTPKDVLEDDMDADELELEAFKRFCQQSVPPKRKEKVAHLNVKDIVLKKKNGTVSA